MAARVATSVAGELAAIGRELTTKLAGYTVTRNVTGGPPPAGTLKQPDTVTETGPKASRITVTAACCLTGNRGATEPEVART